MADSYELVIALDLRDDLSEAELAELRWHLGLGAMPRQLNIVTEFPIVVVNDLGEPVIENEPTPLLGSHGRAARLTGALTAAMQRRDCGWALTARQEVHPDDFEGLGELLVWLAAKAADHHTDDGAVRIGSTRFYEDDQPTPLLVRDCEPLWPLPNKLLAGHGAHLVAGRIGRFHQRRQRLLNLFKLPEDLKNPQGNPVEAQRLRCRDEVV